jgi:hypothetical protein
MNDRRFDDDLKGRFAQLRREVAHQVPPFHQVRSAAAERRDRRRWPRFAVPLAAALAAMLVAASLWWAARDNGQVEGQLQADSTRLAAAWESPTDFLLSIHGSEILRTVPCLGCAGPWELDLAGHAEAAPSASSTPRRIGA